MSNTNNELVKFIGSIFKQNEVPHHPITSLTDLRDNVIESMFNSDFKPEKD